MLNVHVCGFACSVYRCICGMCRYMCVCVLLWNSKTDIRLAPAIAFCFILHGSYVNVGDPNSVILEGQAL